MYLRKNKSSLIAVGLYVLLACSPVFSQKNSGVLITTISTQELPNNTHSTMLFEERILGDKLRRDIYFGGVKGKAQFHTTTINDVSTGRMISIIHAQKSYRDQGPEELEQQKRQSRNILSETIKALPNERPELRRTDETDEISGYAVRKFVAKLHNGKATYWITEDDEELRALARRVARMSSTPTGEMLNLQFPDSETLPGYPLKTIHDIEHSGRKIKTVNESTVKFDVEMSPADFEPPKGYTEMR